MKANHSKAIFCVFNMATIFMIKQNTIDLYPDNWHSIVVITEDYNMTLLRWFVYIINSVHLFGKTKNTSIKWM